MVSGMLELDTSDGKLEQSIASNGKHLKRNMSTVVIDCILVQIYSYIICFISYNLKTEVYQILKSIQR